MNEHEAITHPAVKVATAWGLIGITTWADAASFAAFAYTMVLLCEWVWKRLLRPFARRHGWVEDRVSLRETDDE